ncbi:MAG: phenylacetate--CoA ligase family protein [Solirubrobacterales bacterium]
MTEKGITRRFLRLTGLDNIAYAVPYTRTLRQVNKLMQLDGRQLHEFQQQRLRTIVRYAYDNVELYRKKWQQFGVHPDDIQTVADLKKLPIITKDDLREGFPDAIRSREFRPEDCFTVGTSGSTGSPVRVFVDFDKTMIDFALSEPRYMGGMPPITFRRAVRDCLVRRNVMFMSIFVNNELAYETLYARMFSLMRHTVVDCLLPPSVHIAMINEKKPLYLHTYASVLRNVCAAAKEAGVKMHHPKLIFTTGEVTDPHLRTLVRETFGTDLLDSYASVEFGFIACECPRHEGLHVFSWKALVELLDPQGRKVPDGQAGRVVVTDLFNRATPLIRYSGLGDYAVRKKDPCSCGRPLPLLGRLEGRMVDSVILPNGQMVHPYSLTLALEDIPHLNKFQIRQERPDHVRVLLVKDRTREAEGVSFTPGGDLGRSILNRLSTILKNQVSVELETTEDIPKKPGHRKYATVVSLVDRE